MLIDLLNPDQLESLLLTIQCDKSLEIIEPNDLRNPKPNPLKHVPRLALRPNDSIESSLASMQICLFWANKVCALEYSPEQVQSEKDGDTDIVGNEALIVKPTSENIEARRSLAC